MSRCAAILSLAVVVGGCNLLLDVGDHELRQAPVPGASASGGAGGSGGTGAAGSGGSGGGTGGGAEPTAIASGQQSPGAIALDATYVYWINEASPDHPGAIMRAPKAGGDPVALLSGIAKPTALRAGNANIGFTNDINASGADAGVFVFPKGGGAVDPVGVDGFGAGALVLHSGFFYSAAWESGGPARVRKSPGSGCYPYTAPASGGKIVDLRADDVFLYFIDTTENGILRSGLDCGAAAATFAANQGDARALALDISSVYWITPSSVLQLGKGKPNGLPKVLVQGETNLTALDLRAGTLVFATGGDSGTVSRMELSGSPVVVATGQPDPAAVLVDIDGAIFWSNRAGGQIMKLVIPPG